jgi:hypothetical protein
LGNVLEWFVILIEEITWKLTHVLTVLEFGSGDLACFLEITVFVKSLVNLVFNLGFEVKVLQ